MRGRVWRTTALVITAAAGVVGCGGDDDGGGLADNAQDAAEEVADDRAGGSGGSGGGEVVLGDETITFESARCFLEEQDAAAGGGKILFVGQGFGTDAAGEPVVIDVSRYDEDSMFTGDDVTVDIGDPFGDTAVSWRAAADLGTVSVDGSRLSADGLTFVNGDDLSEQSGSFTIDC